MVASGVRHRKKGIAWRDADYTTYKIVKALKGEPIKGYFQIKIGGQSKRFDRSNVVEFMPPLFQAVATKLNELAQGEFDIVPIPNSSATVRDKAEFKTLAHARAVAAVVGARATAVPSLRWKTAKTPARKGGSRDPQIHLQNLQVVQKPSHQAIKSCCSTMS